MALSQNYTQYFPATQQIPLVHHGTMRNESIKNQISTVPTYEDAYLGTYDGPKKPSMRTLTVAKTAIFQSPPQSMKTINIDIASRSHDDLPRPNPDEMPQTIQDKGPSVNQYDRIDGQNTTAFGTEHEIVSKNCEPGPEPTRRWITEITLTAPPHKQSARILDPPEVILYNISSKHSPGTLYEFVPKATEGDKTPPPTITIHDATVNGRPIKSTMTASKAAMRIIETLVRTFFPEATLQANLDQLHPTTLDHLSTTTQAGIANIEVLVPVTITPKAVGVAVLKLHGWPQQNLTHPQPHCV